MKKCIYIFFKVFIWIFYYETTEIILLVTTKLLIYFQLIIAPEVYQVLTVHISIYTIIIELFVQLMVDVVDLSESSSLFVDIFAPSNLKIRSGPGPVPDERFRNFSEQFLDFITNVDINMNFCIITVYILISIAYR